MFAVDSLCYPLYEDANDPDTNAENDKNKQGLLTNVGLFAGNDNDDGEYYYNHGKLLDQNQEHHYNEHRNNVRKKDVESYNENESPVDLERRVPEVQVGKSKNCVNNDIEPYRRYYDTKPKETLLEKIMKHLKFIVIPILL